MVEGEAGLAAADPGHGDDHTHQGEVPDGGEFGAMCDGVSVPPGSQSGREGGARREESGREGIESERVRIKEREKEGRKNIGLRED